MTCSQIREFETVSVARNSLSLQGGEYRHSGSARPRAELESRNRLALVHFKSRFRVRVFDAPRNDW
jgi:hypothetical protein